MNAHSRFQWTPENTARLREMHAAGATMLRMTVELGAPSRSAVIGKCHRLGLAARTPANCVPPRSQRLEAPKVKPLKQNLHAGNIARKAESRARQKEDASLAQDRALIAAFDLVATRNLPEAKGVLFLKRRGSQCAWPLPGWDDLPVTEKLVCGLPTVGETSWCRHCLPVATSPACRHTSGDRASNRFRVAVVTIRNRIEAEGQP